MRKYWVWYGLLFAFTMGIDRITKHIACLYRYNHYQVMPFVSLHHLYNRGISCGILNSTNQTIFLILSACIALFLLFFALFAWLRFLNNYIIIGETLVIAGGVSNIIDRYLYGGVVDFILISWHDWSFPVFNIADCAIVLGVLCIFYVIISD